MTLQQAEVSGRFHHHRIAGLAQHVERLNDGVHGAVGDHDVPRIGGGARDGHALGNLPAQLRMPGRHEQLARVRRMIAQHLAHQVVEPLVRIQRRRGEGAVERHDVGAAERFAAGFQHFGGHRNRFFRARDLGTRLGQQLGIGRTHIEAGLRPRFDQADVLQVHVCLHDGRHAHLRRATHAAHGRNAVVRAQRADGNLRFHQPRDAFVKQRCLR
jgi:hypothetical protein